MSWTRLDDRWTERPVFEQLGTEPSWHLLCMIQHCSRNHLYDGVMTRKTAVRASLVDDPELALAALVGAGLVEQLPDGTVRVVEIVDHIPPPSVRQASAATKVRVRRHRRHKVGDHSECLPDHCDALRNEPRNALPQEQEQAQEQEVLRPKDVDQNEPEISARTIMNAGGRRAWCNSCFDYRDTCRHRLIPA